MGAMYFNLRRGGKLVDIGGRLTYFNLRGGEGMTYSIWGKGVKMFQFVTSSSHHIFLWYSPQHIDA